MVAALLGDRQTTGFVSVASLWETAIKARLGKLDPGIPFEDIAQSLQKIGLDLLQIDVSHVTTAAKPEPDTLDPFDRLLLAQCQVERAAVGDDRPGSRTPSAGPEILIPPFGITS
jgi:PIN domain nuclease of toxin-antitoxin system